MSHDALRLMARHGTALVAVGEDGVRCYTAPPLMPDSSDIARRQMRAWGDPTGGRIIIARKMYALRLGEVLPQQDIAALRGVEGARMRRTYTLVAQRYGIEWKRRRYDRADPSWADIPNQAINDASVAVTSAAVIAVTATGAIPQLGFIHEHSGEAFALDIADLFPRHCPASRGLPVGPGSHGPSPSEHRAPHAANYGGNAAQGAGHIEND